MTCRALLRTFPVLCALSFLVSCAEYPTSPTTAAPTPPPMGYWNGDGVAGSPKIVVSVSDQRAYFYKGKQLVGESTVSTGKPGFGTPPGYYTVFWKHADHVSSVFGDYVDDFGNVVKSNIDSRKDPKPPGSHYDGARMPFAMFFRGGYAMHQGYVPPYAASHGCIRLPQGMAEIFFNASPPGTPVIVKQEAVMPNFTIPPDATTISAPARTVAQTTTPPPVSPAAIRSTVSLPTPVPLRAPGPASFPPAPVRTTVPAPSPIPLRSPPVVVSRAPVPVQSPGPVLLRSPSPAPLRYQAPTPPAVRPPAVRTTVPTPTPVPLRSPAPVLSHRPAPLQSPAPVTVRSPAPTSARYPAVSPVPLRSPSVVPSRSPAPASIGPTPAPVLSPTPSSTRARKHVRSRHRKHSRVPGPVSAPSPTPTAPQ